MTESHSLDDAVAFLRAHDSYLISSHDPLDGDAVGSEIALALLLESLGKTARILNDAPLPKNLRFLPEVERVVDLGETPCADKFAVMATVDCGGYSNLRGTLDLLAPDAAIINIDHHAGNEMFGRVNYVDSTASAAGTLVFRLIRALGVELTEAMSWSLFTALFSDTGRFSFSNTQPETLEMASELLRHGVAPDVVSHRLYRDKPFNLVQLEAEVTRGIELESEGRIAIVELPREMCDRHGIPPRDVRNLVDLPMQIENIEMALLLREVEPSLTKVSFRSTGKVDVNALAAQFGGGGHRLASGCRIEKPLSEARTDLLAAATDTLGALS